MPDVITPNLSLTKIGINESDSTWGGKLNTNTDKIDQFAGTTNTTFSALTARVAALEAEAAKASFVGEVRMWSGTLGQIGNIPGGVWKLCDGTNGTPDLRDRFVMGAGNVAVGATGGAATKTAQTSLAGQHGHGGITQAHSLTVAEMPSHSHTGGTTSDGQHGHYLSGVWYTGDGNGGNQIPSGSGYKFYIGDAGVYGAGDHGHTLATQNTGADQGHYHQIFDDGNHTHSVDVNVLPPYYALAFIKRVA